jgi:hypothetical protein
LINFPINTTKLPIFLENESENPKPQTKKYPENWKALTESPDTSESEKVKDEPIIPEDLNKTRTSEKISKFFGG